ncbi:ATP-dependent DNA/RNA helicase DHX36 [Neocloeon triangulifer]|uniref:ATP-dependent DNA/RNA helicase DHX36 n=1 Tax=Neocloeon triangulifer TaxID=2078957 RepID=UPI00286F44A7|nr:ATP-dependent DNA/RNA helicase DHX36 [Neocloeon triangulifer]XP_059476226.1 ATP-dependent DNA/RNA helicase DHX36 [Neocloeon triangulifer]
MSRGGFFRGRGGRGHRFFGAGSSSGSSKQGNSWNENFEESGGSFPRNERKNRPPPGLRGRDIGMYYKNLALKKRGGDFANFESREGFDQNTKRKFQQEESKKKLRVSLDGARQSRISEMLAATPFDGPTESFAYHEIADSEFKRRFLKNLDGNLKGNGDDLVFDPMEQDIELDQTLQKELEKKQLDFRYIKMKQDRAKLPAADKCDEILNAVQENQVIVISGETGCGKTTQVPQFILDDAIKKGQGSMCRIICTQPRRISAITIAQRVADERTESLGKSVGYQIRLENAIPRKKGCILFCTTGILLQFLQSDPNLTHTSHIVIDEIHEQDILSDFILTIVRDLLPRRPDLKVILMSATLNAESFSKYYHRCPMVHIPGFTHPVTVYHLEDVLKMTNFKVQSKARDRPKWTNYTADGKERRRANDEYSELMGPFLRHLKSKGTYPDHVLDSLSLPESEEINFELMASLVQYICQTQPEGAILIFLPGWDQISKLHKMITESSFYSKSRFQVLPLHSQMPTVNQKEIFLRPPHGVRKIIIATNIAETSITINDVVYVIDCGKIKMKNYKVEENIQTLQPEWVSFANAKQRRGRAGRVQPGVCYHLFTQRREMTLASYPIPEMLRSRLEEVILQVKILQLGKVAPFLEKVMQPPNPIAIDHALELLKVISALDEDENLTPLGFHLAQLPMDPQLGKMILMAALFRCLDPVLSIAASLSFKEPFNLPLGFEKKVDQLKFELSKGQKSDHLVLSEAMRLWEQADTRGEGNSFCRRNFLSLNTLNMLHRMKSHLAEHLQKMKFVSSSDPKDPDFNIYSKNYALVKAVVSAGLYPNIAILNKVRKEKKLLKTATDRRVCLHPKSVNNFPSEFESPLFVYHLKLKSATVYLHDSTMVYPLPLLFFGSRLRQQPETTQNSTELAMDQFEFQCSEGTAKLLMELRKRLDSLLEFKITHPHIIEWRNSQSAEKSLVQAIVELISTEDKTNQMGFQDYPDDDSE